jgi:hypothetical protein
MCLSIKLKGVFFCDIGLDIGDRCRILLEFGFGLLEEVDG